MLSSWLDLLELAITLKLPKLAAHLAVHDIRTVIFSTAWFISLFTSTKCLGESATLWCWDWLLLSCDGTSVEGNQSKQGAGGSELTLGVLNLALAILCEVQEHIESDTQHKLEKEQKALAQVHALSKA